MLADINLGQNYVRNIIRLLICIMRLQVLKKICHSWDILQCTTQGRDLNFFSTCMHMV